MLTKRINLKAWGNRLVAYPHFPFILILLLNLTIGLVVTRDYGESWDEHLRYRYAERSLSAYIGHSSAPTDEKGPFFVMVARIGTEVIRSVYKGWQPIEAWHFMIFLSFLMGLFFFYMLCQRFVGKWAALFAVLLFNTQPLLWGHAWINPKDIPFMAFFLGSVALGLVMVVTSVDSQIEPQGVETNLAQDTSLFQNAIREWKLSSKKKRSIVAWISALSILLLVILIFSRSTIQSAIEDSIQVAYSTPTSLIGQLFSILAVRSREIPSELYVQKGLKLFSRFTLIYTGAAFLLNLILGVYLWPGSISLFWRNQIRPFLGCILMSLTKRKVLLAGVFLGLCASIRVIGPASGLLIAGLYLLKRKQKALPVLVAYFAVAAVTTYLTWPALWSAPIKSYLGSISQASDFPWEGKVLFNGIDYGVEDLPRSYLPRLLTLQFTESALVLILLGLVMGLKDFIQLPERRLNLALAAAWFSFPLAATVILHPTIYDNFRQFLFIIPPLFIFAAIGAQSVLDRIRSVPILVLACALLLAPNLYQLVKLHPYQYVYYNQLAGGVQGAFRNYELDYWATSYREAAEYLNANAPTNANLIVWGADHLVRSKARPDLTVLDYRTAGEFDSLPNVYAVISTRHDKDLSLYPSAPILLKIGRSGAVFTVIKQLSAANAP